VTRFALHAILYAMSADLVEEGRQLSAAIFGNRAMVTVVTAIEELTETGDSFVTTRVVASATELGDSLVRPVMLRLVAAGVIAQLPRSGGPRSALYYQVQRGDLWDALTTMCKAIAGPVEPESHEVGARRQ
jgi:hypothetical protein